jgi:hypothetical protein
MREIYGNLRSESASVNGNEAVESLAEAFEFGGPESATFDRDTL